ncbi:MAG TPA: hypothetical protein VIO64_10645 [Pseudobacteroides sp.]|uniref:hypothetical protein n=1 Tax=Pseudobacteroides sp. TaxID=1968840 RepID=UPI002F944984
MINKDKILHFADGGFKKSKLYYCNFKDAYPYRIRFTAYGALNPGPAVAEYTYGFEELPPPLHIICEMRWSAAYNRYSAFWLVSADTSFTTILTRRASTFGTVVETKENISSTSGGSTFANSVYMEANFQTYDYYTGEPLPVNSDGNWDKPSVYVGTATQLNYPAGLPPLPADVQKYILIFSLPGGETKIESLEKKGFTYTASPPGYSSVVSPDFQLNHSYMLNNGAWEVVSQQNINAISISASAETFDQVLWCNHDIMYDVGGLYRSSDAIYGQWI